MGGRPGVRARRHRPDGFRRSHRQARAAHRIGVTMSAAITHFDDVELECVLPADERAARAFVANQLAPLDAPKGESSGLWFGGG